LTYQLFGQRALQAEIEVLKKANHDLSTRLAKDERGLEEADATRRARARDAMCLEQELSERTEGLLLEVSRLDITLRSAQRVSVALISRCEQERDVHVEEMRRLKSGLTQPAKSAGIQQQESVVFQGERATAIANTTGVETAPSVRKDKHEEKRPVAHNADEDAAVADTIDVVSKEEAGRSARHGKPGAEGFHAQHAVRSETDTETPVKTTEVDVANRVCSKKPLAQNLEDAENPRAEAQSSPVIDSPRLQAGKPTNIEYASSGHGSTHNKDETPAPHAHSTQPRDDASHSHVKGANSESSELREGGTPNSQYLARLELELAHAKTIARERDEAVRRVGQLELEASSLTREVNKLRAQLAEALQHSSRPPDQAFIAMQQYEVKTISQHAERMALELKHAMLEAEASKGVLREMEQELSRQTKEVATLREALEPAKSAAIACTRQQAELKQRESEILSLTAEIQRLKKDLGGATEIKLAFDQERFVCIEAKEENSKLNALVSSLKKEIEEMKKQVETVDQLTFILSQKENEYSILAVGAERLRAELNEVKQTAALLQQERDRGIVIEDEAVQLTHEISVLRTELARALDRASTAEANMAEGQLWQQQASQLSTQVQYLQVELEALSKVAGGAEQNRVSAKIWEEQVRDVSAQLQHARAELAEAKQASAAMQAAADESVLKKQIVELRQLLDKEKAQVAQLHKQLQVCVMLCVLWCVFLTSKFEK
jgi:hypothetical protein